MTTSPSIDEKPTQKFIAHDQHLTEADIAHGDNALKLVGEQRIVLSDADNKRLLRKTDKHILVILVWVYLLQTLDKNILGNAKIFGLATDVGLKGTQYSMLSSINAMVQLGWQPFSSYLLVRVPPRTLMTALVFLWGTAQTCLAACNSYHSLLACRALLGLFEAGCLPLFSILTAQFYRRSEQPQRVAAWYCVGGVSTMLAAIMSWGLGHIHHSKLYPWQAIFLVSGLLTVLSTPLVWIFVDSDVASARFFTEDEKLMAIERLRANQTGTGSNDFKWKQALEIFWDPKSYLFASQTLLVGVGAAVASYFGPTLIAAFGYDTYTTSLLNIPTGFLQILIIQGASFAAHRFRSKSTAFSIFMIPAIIGIAMLYNEETKSKKDFRQPVALAGYYLINFVFGATPLIVSWMIANVGSQSKKSATLSLYNASSAAGNLIGPLLFPAQDAPHYLPGIRAVLGITSAVLAAIIGQVGVLYLMNRQQRAKRVKNGKPEFIKDTSMANTYSTYGESAADEVAIGQNALLDMTDMKNDEFVYVY
ncbi:MFS general substrate transporter [Meredithblackwellia eburnea MCA 4105]